MATFDFNRLKVGVDSSVIVNTYLNYEPIKDLTIVSPTKTSFQIKTLTSTLQYVGTGLKYKPNGDPKKGVITELNTFWKDHVDQTFNITGLNIDVKKMIKAFETNDLHFAASIFASDDTFIGSKSHDKLFGFLGNDSMRGMSGNDTLDGGFGNDTLVGGKGNDSLIGSLFDDVLKGDNGTDVLDGGGDNDALYSGRGNDTVTGGEGADAFHFEFGVNDGSNVDVITDFNPADDTIMLKASIFKGLGGAGVLAEGKFVVGEVADHKDGGIIYDANGDLWWDKAGSPAFKFAHLDGAPTLTHEDFVIV
jgi:Ca2+-binding RTX toxin-like protein